jgi:hypothetical protein
MPGFFARIVAPLASVAVLGSIVLGGVSRTEAASIGVNWTAPTTNADGSPLRDLAGYRLYIDTHTPACPSGSFHAVSSSTASPPAGQQITNRLTGLVANTTYFARVTAVDGNGNESACSGTASGVARTDVTVTPTATVSFGSVASGSTVDRSFTVQNTSGASLSGSASVGAPYRIVSGSPFSLATNATATVVVRFQPTAAGTFATNVNFSAAGDTQSRAVSGSATGGTSSPPPSTGSLAVAITQPLAGATVRGPASVVLWVEGTSGSSNVFTLSAAGKVVGTQTTSSRGPVVIPWTPTVNGNTALTASVRDASGRTGSTTTQVNVQGASGGVTTPPPPPPPPSGTISVALTAPKEDTLVRRGATVTLWVEGTSGSANSFNLVANGKFVGGVNTASRGPVQIPWTATTNGTNTLTAWVRDATGRTGSTSIQVWVVDATAAAVTSPANDTLSVFITQPTQGATLRGTAWAVLWAAGTTGSTNTYALSVNGRVVGTATTGSRGPVTIPWTTAGTNGPHTLTAMVRDASGHTGRMSIPVTLRN